MTSGTSGIGHFIAFIGRIFFALYFLVNGVFNAVNFDAIVQSLSNIQHVDGLILVMLILQLLGGVLLLFGWYARIAAFILFLAVVLMTWLEFLVVPMDTGSMSATMSTFMHFIDNLGIAGATLYFMAYGAGAISLDFFRGRSKRLED